LYILSNESSTSITKHADSIGYCVPALNKVGELGRKYNSFIILKTSEFISSIDSGVYPYLAHDTGTILSVTLEHSFGQSSFSLS
jgi:hypothetical protein